MFSPSPPALTPVLTFRRSLRLMFMPPALTPVLTFRFSLVLTFITLPFLLPADEQLGAADPPECPWLARISHRHRREVP